MKKLINKVDDVVSEMLDGIAMAHDNILERVEGYGILKRKDLSKDKVRLISGGGSGHEPAHGGFVGYGMLDAAISGEVFTSPTVDQVYKAIEEVQSEAGCLLVIKNYSGDVMNFEMAKEMAEASGIKIAQVIINDDVAVEDSLYTTGRRGVAGTIFVHKIAGALAERGEDLDSVQKGAEKVIANVRTLGLALDSGIVPAHGSKNFELAEDEIEMGVGIHGEPGIKREKLKSVDEHVEYMLDKILNDIKIEKGDEVAVLVNGLGATPLMELYIAYRKVENILNELGININYKMVGNLMTSLEMPGFSISLLKLDDEMKDLLNAPSLTPAWKEGR